MTHPDEQGSIANMRWSVRLKAFIVVPALLLASCTNFCQNVADRGAEYDGVQLTDPAVYYSLNGKKYMQGRRAKFRRTEVEHPWRIVKPRPQQFALKADTLGELVYSEVKIDEEGEASLVDGENWHPLAVSAACSHPLPEPMCVTSKVDTSSRDLTPHAFYSYPLAAVTLICVDVPLNIAGAATVVALGAGAGCYVIIAGAADFISSCFKDTSSSKTAAP